MQKVELELKDYKDMEREALEQLRNGKKILIVATEILTLATININKLGGETEGERIERVKKETEIEKQLKKWMKAQYVQTARQLPANGETPLY